MDFANPMCSPSRNGGIHVAFMLHGAADRFRKSLEINENKLQHAQHEIGRHCSGQFRFIRCRSKFWWWRPRPESNRRARICRLLPSLTLDRTFRSSAQSRAQIEVHDGIN